MIWTLPQGSGYPLQSFSGGLHGAPRNPPEKGFPLLSLTALYKNSRAEKTHEPFG
ncbi:MAG: hypothetical protein WBA16_04270 [Nonlabens sp.]